jgi:hypothetical protein
MASTVSAAAILPRVHQAMMTQHIDELWNICDSHTRLLWCSLAHVPTWAMKLDPFNGEELEPQLQIENYTLIPFEYLPMGHRLKLSNAPGVMISFLRNLAKLSAKD